MIGLKVDGRPLMRAYSIVSAHYDDHLEFLSIKVPDGALTSRLQHVKPEDAILINRKTTGTLTLDNLKAGKRLYLLATGTGIAPFLSIIQDPETYERYEKVVLAHSCRQASELETRNVPPSSMNWSRSTVAADGTNTVFPSRTRRPDPNTRSVRSNSPELNLPSHTASQHQSSPVSTCDPCRTRITGSDGTHSAIQVRGGQFFSGVRSRRIDRYTSIGGSQGRPSMSTRERCRGSGSSSVSPAGIPLTESM